MLSDRTEQEHVLRSKPDVVFLCAPHERTQVARTARECVMKLRYHDIPKEQQTLALWRVAEEAANLAVSVEEAKLPSKRKRVRMAQ